MTGFSADFLKIATEFADCDRKLSIKKLLVEIHFMIDLSQFVTDWHSVGKFSERKNWSQKFQTDFLTDIFSQKNSCDRIMTDEKNISVNF